LLQFVRLLLFGMSKHCYTLLCITFFDVYCEGFGVGAIKNIDAELCGCQQEC